MANNNRDFVTKEWEEAGLSNDIIFGMVMEDKKNCINFLKMVLPELNLVDLIDIEPIKQQDISQYNFRGIRLDISAVDSKGNQYDIEMQRTDNDNIAKRTRFYHSRMTGKMLKPGERFDTLKSTYVIFVCEYDPFNKGNPIYRFESYDKQNDIKLNDGSYTIILNASCDLEQISNPELKEFFELIRDYKEENYETLFASKLANDLKTIKEDKQKEEIFMSSLEKYGEYCREQGIEQGIEQERLSAVNSYAKYVQNKTMSVELATQLISDSLSCSKKEAESILFEKLNLVQA